MTGTTLTITRRSRIGFSWTNSPRRWVDRFGQSHLEVGDPANEPGETGYVRRVCDAFHEVARKNNANDWCYRWYARHGGKWVPVQIDRRDLYQLLCGDGCDRIEAKVIEQPEGDW